MGLRPPGGGWPRTQHAWRPPEEGTLDQTREGGQVGGPGAEPARLRHRSRRSWGPGRVPPRASGGGGSPQPDLAPLASEATSGRATTAGATSLQGFAAGAQETRPAPGRAWGGPPPAPARGACPVLAGWGWGELSSRKSQAEPALHQVPGPRSLEECPHQPGSAPLPSAVSVPPLSTAILSSPPLAAAEITACLPAVTRSHCRLVMRQNNSPGGMQNHGPKRPAHSWHLSEMPEAPDPATTASGGGSAGRDPASSLQEPVTSRPGPESHRPPVHHKPRGSDCVPVGQPWSPRPPAPELVLTSVQAHTPLRPAAS